MVEAMAVETSLLLQMKGESPDFILSDLGYIAAYPL
jgi:hypothetical protein